MQSLKGSRLGPFSFGAILIAPQESPGPGLMLKSRGLVHLGVCMLGGKELVEKFEKLLSTMVKI